MSVSIHIKNPQSLEEESFSRAVSSQRSFKEEWLPVCSRLSLGLLSSMADGFRLNKGNFKTFIEELKILRADPKPELDEATSAQIDGRIDTLLKELPNLVSERDDIVFVVG